MGKVETASGLIAHLLARQASTRMHAPVIWEMGLARFKGATIRPEIWARCRGLLGYLSGGLT